MFRIELLLSGEWKRSRAFQSYKAADTAQSVLWHLFGVESRIVRPDGAIDYFFIEDDINDA